MVVVGLVDVEELLACGGLHSHVVGTEQPCDAGVGAEELEMVDGKVGVKVRGWVDALPPSQVRGRGRLRRQPYKFQFVGQLCITDV